MSTNRPATALSAHAKKFIGWRNLAPTQTRYLVDGIVEILLPLLESQGFSRVSFERLDSSLPVSGSEIVLERIGDREIDSVTFNLEKYRRPRFQIHFSRRDRNSPNNFIRSANLVRKSSQYYHFWGKPWWFPTKLWPESATRRTLAEVQSQLVQVLHFLDNAERGRNISKAVPAPIPR